MKYLNTVLEPAHQYNSHDPSHAARVSIQCTNDEVAKIERIGGLNHLRRRINGLMSLVAGGNRDDEKQGRQTIIFVMNGSALAMGSDERSAEEFGRATYDIVRAYLG